MDVDIRREAFAIVRCVEELRERFGVGVVAETLCGADTEKVRRYRLAETSTYGSLRDLTQSEVRQCIRFLLDEGVLTLSGGQYPMVQLGVDVREKLEGELYMRTLKDEVPAAPVKKVPAELYGRQAELYDQLRALRSGIARRQSVPAYAVFSDKTLREMAVVQPRTMEALRRISGVGDVKASRYGRAFLAEIEQFEA